MHSKGVIMKKGKIFSICLTLSVIIASFCFIFLPLNGGETQNITNQKVNASYSRGETYTSSGGEIGNTKHPTYLNTLNIPYALYTSYKPSTEDTEAQITDYYPDVTTENDLQYIMGVESAPYILLSSKQGEADSILRKLYNTTLVFRFNTQDMRALDTSKNYASLLYNSILTKTTIKLQNTNGKIDIYNNYVGNGESNILNMETNASFEFKLNLQEDSTSSNGGCPAKRVEKENGDYDAEYLAPSLRTGLYTITFYFDYMLNGKTYTNMTFSISFYVIDYSDYVSEQNTSPLCFDNTTKYILDDTTIADSGDLTSDYYLYNYNSANAPVIHYDASKFALNFKYYVGNNEDSYYEFLYDGFVPLNNDPVYSGYVTLKCERLGATYTIYTKDTRETATGTERNSRFYAYLDLKDFETNFILQNSAMLTSVFQGKFLFSLDILTSGSASTSQSTTFTTVDKELFGDDVQNNLSFQNLIIYGYDLKYQDDNPSSSTYKKSISLVNDVTHTNIYSKNDYSEAYVSIPTQIATTNILQLEFHGYGNLSYGGSTSKAKCYLIQNITTENETKVLTALDSLKTANPDSVFNADIFSENGESPYTYNMSFSAYGIYFLKLDYSIYVNMTTEKTVEGVIEQKKVQQTISGTQYVLFEINNSAQELYIHAIEEKDNQLLAYDFTTYTNKKVRVAIEEKNNMFYANSSVAYSYNKDFAGNIASGTLAYKLDGDKKASYTINGKKYNYYVSNQDNDYTFDGNGSYSVNIMRNNKALTGYLFKIDKDEFGDIAINKAVASNTGYVKGERLTTTNLNEQYIERDLYITDGAFTLGWQEKASNATIKAYVVYMKLKEDTSSENLKLLQQSSTEYWLTNKYYFESITPNAESSYQNSYNLTELGARNYFEQQGLWYFFLYDQAGNYTTLAVLIDSSLPSIAQGEWSGNFENSSWTSTYNLTNNPSNYVNSNTYLYFGTHKAIAFSDNIKNEEVSITIKYNENLKNCYIVDSSEEAEVVQSATFDFKNDVLYKLTNYIKINQGTSLFDTTYNEKNYYLLSRNTSYTYSFNPISTNEKTASNGTQTIDSNTNPSNYYVGLYAQEKNRQFSGEANYVFTLTNSSNLSTTRKITMNFENITTAFYAYNQADNPIYIEKGSGTNLKRLCFTYRLSTDSELADYYEIDSLTYTYYPFALTKDETGYNKTTYPFSSISSSSTDMKSLKETRVDSNGTYYIINGINPNTSGDTLPGKYVITRTYVGGNYVYNSTTKQYEETPNGKGGTHYKDTNGEYQYLFNTDQLTRSYEVYVDNNQIINTSKNIGNNIILSLTNGDNVWSFADFNKYTSTSFENLKTNLVPVQINLPYSKYFYKPTTGSNDFVSSNYNFSKLNLKVTYKAKDGTTTTYNADGYNSTTGMVTCSKLITTTNTEGYFIFDKEGTYTLYISDNTGYDLSTNQVIAYNQSPTSMTFSFEISYSSISADAYTYIGDNLSFKTTKLTSERSGYFSTNAQVTSTVIDEDGNKLNKIYLTFSDPANPYSSKVSTIKIYSKSRDAWYTIDALSNTNKLYALDKKTSSFIAIDKTELLTTDYLCYLQVDYYDPSNPSEKYDNTDYFRYTYKLYFTLQEEDEFQIFLLTNNSSSLIEESVYTLSIDRTKPYSNLDKLIKNETFLQLQYKDNLSKFLDENVFDGTEKDTDLEDIFYNSPNNLNYTFGVSNTFALGYNENETVSYFYVRKYNKYNGEYPSITPDMANTKYSKFANYPVFNEDRFTNDTISYGENTWYKINYVTSATLYNQIISATGVQAPKGYYEIIERDIAGNYRSFTVYFSDGTPLVTIDGIDSEQRTYEDNIDDNLTANKTFQITKLSSKLGWGILKITNETYGTGFPNNIVLKPNINILTSGQIQQNLDKLMGANSRFSFELVKYNDSFPASKRSVSVITDDSTAKLNAPTIKEELDITTNTTIYKLVFPAYSDKEALYLTQLVIRKYDDINGWQSYSEFTTKESIANANPLKVEKGTYKVIYKDNYNKENAYEYNIYVGEDTIKEFDERYQFASSKYYVDTENNIYYTGGAIQVTYEANIYSNIYVNGKEWTDTKTVSNSKYKTFTLSSSYDLTNVKVSEAIGGATTYIVNYKDKTGSIIEDKSITFVIFDKLPEILLKNNNDKEISSSTYEVSSQITNSIVKIDWGKITDCEFNDLNDSDTYEATTLNLYSKKDNGNYEFEKVIKRADILAKNNIIDKAGFYKLEVINNRLGNARYAYFAIQFGDLPFYSVTDGTKELSPSSYEKLDITTTLYQSGATTTLLDIIKDALTSNKSASSLSKNASSTQTIYEALLESFGYTKTTIGTDTSYVFSKNNIGIAKVTNLNHYYSTTDMQVVYNSNINLSVVEFLFENGTFKRCYVKETGTSPSTIKFDYNNNYYTTIYLVHNLPSTSPEIHLFATTRVPLSTSLLSSSLKNGSKEIDLTSATAKTSIEITNSQDFVNGKLILGFNSLKYGTTTEWYNQGNYIYCLEQYGKEDGYTPLDFYSTSSSFNYVALQGSGTHKLKFMDFAGNVHKFSNNSFDSEPETYTMYIITKVIYYINYKDSISNPVENAIYNDEMSLQLDDYYTNKSGFTYNVIVSRNGQRYTNYTSQGNLITFNEAGRYVVTFTATYKNVELESAVCNFTILSTTSARLAYEFTETEGYEITKVIRNGVDITSNFEKNGKVTSLFISSTDSLSGNGYYTITLKYGDKDSDQLEYSFLINNYVPTIYSSIDYGETTTKDIYISYNPSYIYNQLGRCYVVVYVYNSDSKAFYEYGRYTIDEDSNTVSLATFPLTRSYSYFVQVKTETGNTLTSFRVDKKDPLNTFAIIIIIVSVIAAVVLTIVIIKLRTRMRVK